MKSIIITLEEKITVKTALLFTAVFAVFLWLIDFSPIGVAGLLKITGGANILDYETRYTAQEGYAMLEALGEAGRAFHLYKIMPLDIFFPASLMLCGFCWLSVLVKYVSKPANILRFLPLLSVINMLCDWTENAGITAMLINYPDRLPNVCVCTGMVSCVKQWCVLGLLISAVVLTGAAAVKKIKRGINYEA